MAAVPAYKCTLSPELLEKAEKELNEKADTRGREIQLLRDRVQANKALTCPHDDAFLLRFLRARKFDQERAYQLLINYYTLRAENAAHFKDFTPATIRKVLDAGVTTALPLVNKEGPRIILFRPGQWNPDEYPIWDIFRTNAMTLEKIIMEEETQVNGTVLIGDFGNVGWHQAKNLDRAYASLFTRLMQDSFPSRFKGVHLFNEPSFFGIVFAIVKPFLKSKLASRFHFHGPYLESLHSQFSVDCLPEDLGGTLGPASELSKKWNDELFAAEDVFKGMANYKIELPRDISGGVGGQGDDQVMTGLTGTYKKLSVD